MAFLALEINSIAISLKPYLSHIPITGRVNTNKVIYLVSTKDLPKISKISIKLNPATSPVVSPETSTTAIISNFKANPRTTIKTPINFIISFYPLLK